MGKLGRAKRADEKRLARWFGITKDELGRTKLKETKAQARRRLVRHHALMWMAEKEIVDLVCKKAHDDVCAQADAEVFAELTRAVEGTDAQDQL